MTASPELEREHFALLSIFFPMWNEEAYIHRAVRAAKEVCECLVTDGEIGDYELIVVDDASTDATGRLADELAAADAHIRVVHHPRNRKLGGFNGSSQHLDRGGVDGQAGRVDEGVDGQVADEVAGGAVASPRGRARVLA